MALGLGASAYAAAVPGETHQATGCKVGEMTEESARFWLRRTASSQRLVNGIVRKGHQQAAKYLAPDARTSVLEGAAPGATGYVRVVYRGAKSGATRWLDVTEAADYAVQTTVIGLRPNTAYTYSVETRATRRGRVDGELTGAFRTLPLTSSVERVRVAMLSCQMYCHMDRPDGFHIYESIQRDSPQFLLSCGDNVYYDNEDPIANREDVARYHWQRMYSLPTLTNCLRQVGGYWQKDDHDVLSDDAWPSLDDKKMKPLTFVEGQRIFREQVPEPGVGKPLYRTVRVGTDLELWLPESRDYRTPNNGPDGPQKTIWGAEQKRWLMTSLAASKATWKVLVNPNPIVGPDRKTKNDNHSNAGFAHESREIRNFLKSNFDGNVISVCGDRHWQYHSIDPETGLHEFGCGAASDLHAGGTPGLDPVRHQFHRVLGGYLSIDVNRDGGTCALRLSHRDVHGVAVHGHTFRRQV
jgi:alkaline phosphatase D